MDEVLARVKKSLDNTFIELTVNNVIKEKTVLRFLKGFNTACWAYKPPHQITFGTEILNEIIEGTEIFAFNSYFYHELGHFLYTERDLTAVNKALKANKIEFKLFNLFEDARIEELIRREFKMAFRWLDFEKKREYDTSKAEIDMLYLIQSEGKAQANNPKVREYYDRALKANDSFDLIPIILEWLEDFPETNQRMSSKDAGLGLPNDLKDGIEMMNEPDDIFIQISSNNRVEDTHSNPGNGKNESGKKDDRKMSEAEKNYFDTNEISKMEEKLKQVLIGRVEKVSTRRPSKNMSIKNIIRESDKIYRRPEEKRRAIKKFNLVIDCSGSMSGKPLKGASQILLTFSRLAKQGMIDGNVLLSSSQFDKVFSLSEIDYEVILEEVMATGSENFALNFEKYRNMLSKADINFVITDGRICDGDLDKLKMQANGIFTWGLYVGQEDDCNLSNWFHRYNSKETSIELIEEIVRISIPKY